MQSSPERSVTVFDWFIDRPSLSVPRIEEDDSAAV